jgi:hypothetical protein
VDDTEVCALPVPPFVPGDPPKHVCGRPAHHTGRCIDKNVIAKYGYCEQHARLLPCLQCKEEAK